MHSRSTLAVLAAPALLLLFVQPISAAKLNPTEQRLVTAAAAENTRAIELLEMLVNINSGTMNLEIGRAHV